MISGIIAIIVALVGGLFYNKTKRQSSEALLANQETKEKLLEVDKANLVDSANLQVEKQKVERLKEAHEKVGPNEESIKDILDFFNNSNKPK